MKAIRRFFRHFLQNVSLKKMDGVFVAFDSDDWGATRVPDKETRDFLQSNGFEMSNDFFTMYDGIENDNDLELLVSTLAKYGDSFGRHPNFTLNICANNPDYRFIYENLFNKYRSSTFIETYGSSIYEDSAHCLEIIKHGKEAGVFSIQLHGSEHANVLRWMSDLKKNPKLAISCNNGLTSCGTDYRKDNRFAYMDELNYYSKEELKQCIERIVSAKAVLEKEFQIDISCLTPSCGVIPFNYKKLMKDADILYSKGSFKQFAASKKKEKLRTIYIFKKKYKDVNMLVRNCTFEPTTNKRALFDCLEDVDYAIKHGKPCIISTHRINYTSRVDKNNRDKCILLLSQLIEKIKEKYPSVQFVSTDYLASKMFLKERR